jgi:hypothetical protein
MIFHGNNGLLTTEKIVSFSQQQHQGGMTSRIRSPTNLLLNVSKSGIP